MLATKIDDEEYFKNCFISPFSSSCIDPPKFLDACNRCNGTEYSGPALFCDGCSAAETHLHCLCPPLAEVPQGDWYCAACTIKYKDKSSPLLNGSSCFLGVTPDRSAGPPSVLAAETAENNPSESAAAQDDCFLCGLGSCGGSLAAAGGSDWQRCAEADCGKAYHQVCIAGQPTLCSPPALWRCPRHRCVQCLGQGSASRLLFQCSRCTYAICSSCDASLFGALSTQQAVARSLSVLQPSAVVLPLCLLCLAPPPSIVLAREQEQLWVRHASAADPWSSAQCAQLSELLQRVRQLRFHSSAKLLSELQGLSPLAVGQKRPREGSWSDYLTSAEPSCTPTEEPVPTDGWEQRALTMAGLYRGNCSCAAAPAAAVVRLGDGDLMTELQLANDNLKHRLANRSAALKVSAGVVLRLQARIRELSRGEK